MCRERCCLFVVVMGVLSAATAVAEEGYTPLFDGKTLDGWKGATKSYEVVEGNIVCVKGSRGNLLTEKEYGDFVLRFEFKLTPGANNGLAIRSPYRAQGNLHLDGIEIQILDDSAEKFKTLKEYQYHGSVYGVVPAKRGFLKPVGQWNEQTVAVVGPHVRVVLNGTTIVDADLDEARKNGTIDGVKHPGLPRKKGHLGFLGHGDRIELRQIRIKQLD